MGYRIHVHVHVPVERSGISPIHESEYRRDITHINFLNMLFSLKDKNGRIASGMRQLPSCTEGIPLLRNRWSFVPQGGGEVVVAMPHT